MKHIKHYLNKITFVSSALLLVSSAAIAKPEATPTWTDPVLAQKEHSGFKYLGEYTNKNRAIQVSPEGNKFYVANYSGGLPGAGWDGKSVDYQRLDENQLKQLLTEFSKVDRGVKTGSYPAPDNATVIFDGKKSKALGNAKVVDGSLLAGALINEELTDFQLHIEFRTPYKPEREIGHPDRGNSGLYMLKRYEVQVMDCFALPYDETEWKKQGLMKSPAGCNGAIYKVNTPATNMSFPALTWQSFDIDFTAARFEGGKKIKNARMSVIHNGVKIHDDVEVKKGTGNQGKNPELASGPIYIQNHHNPVQYRNIWLVKH
jgi:hypothetical protein